MSLPPPCLVPEHRAGLEPSLLLAARRLWLSPFSLGQSRDIFRSLGKGIKARGIGPLVNASANCDYSVCANARLFIPKRASLLLLPAAPGAQHPAATAAPCPLQPGSSPMCQPSAGSSETPPHSFTLVLSRAGRCVCTHFAVAPRPQPCTIAQHSCFPAVCVRCWEHLRLILVCRGWKGLHKAPGHLRQEIAGTCVWLVDQTHQVGQ